MTASPVTEGSARNDGPAPGGPVPGGGLGQTADQSLTRIEQQFALIFHRSRSRWKESAQAVHPELQPLAGKILTALLDGPLQPKHLCEYLMTDKSVLSRQIAHLDELGLIERSAGEHDGRVRQLTITPAAAQRLRAIRTQRHEELAHAVRDWTDEELTTFADLLGRFGEAL